MSSYKCVGLTIVLLLLPAAINAQPKAGTLKIKPYTFENGKGEKVPAEFGTLFVPENRSDPQTNLIELAFVRFKSTAKNPGPPIVYLAGGPGGSGIGTATGSRFPLFMALREIGDVIAFDQRGTGYSDPYLGCTIEEEAEFLRFFCFSQTAQSHIKPLFRRDHHIGI